MRTTIYAYPWDVARLGPEHVLDDLADKGIEAIDLAATYHPIDAFSPRGQHLFTSPRGAVHFPARTERYGRITPTFAPDPEIRAAWPAVAKAAASRGIAVNSWTVILFQPWMVDAHPDTARVLPSGDRVGSILCQSSPDVQEYLANLCADLVDQFDIGTLRLEMIAVPTFDYGWMRPRILVDIPPLARQLLAACFCRSCIKRGVTAGLDIEAVRRTVLTAVDSELRSETAEGAEGRAAESRAADEAADRAADLIADPELHHYLHLQERSTVDLVEATVSLIDPARRPRLSTIAHSPFSLLVEEDLSPLLAAVDQALVFPAADPDQATRVASHRVGLTTFVVPVDLGVLAGLSAGAGGVRGTLQAAAKVPLEEVSVYNYGLLPDRDLTSVLRMIREELP